jgi:hypothetical protein
VVRKRKIKYIDACGGGRVISDFVFDLYRGWFEDSALKVPVRVINATEGGARIANTREESLTSLVRSLPARKTSPARILATITDRKTNLSPRNLIQGLDQAIEDMTGIEQIAASALKKGAASSKEAEAAIEKKGLAPVFNPFLKKSRLYIARHDLDNGKEADLLLKDIAAACARLLPLFRQCSERLKNPGAGNKQGVHD